jgi:hypothetical protein
MEDILFSRTLFVVGETEEFIPGQILAIEFYNNLQLITFYREIISIS